MHSSTAIALAAGAAAAPVPLPKSAFGSGARSKPKALRLDCSLQVGTGRLQLSQPVFVQAPGRYGSRVGCAAEGEEPEQRLRRASQLHD